MSQIKVNVHHSNMYAKKVAELFLFLKLRVYAAANGGSIIGFNLEQKDKEAITRMTYRGWIDRKRTKVNKYRTIVLDAGCANVYTMLDEKYLTDLDTFKGWLIATAESYCLQHKHNLNIGRYKTVSKCGTKDKVDWSSVGVCGHTAAFLKTEKIGFGDGTEMTGRCFNIELVRLMGISDRTVTVWRNKVKVNKYKFSTLAFSDTERNNVTNAVWNDRVERNSVFRSAKKRGRLVSIDMKTTSSLQVFQFKLKNRKGCSVSAKMC